MSYCSKEKKQLNAKPNVPNLTPREEANCRRYRNLSYAHEPVEQMEPKTKVFPLPLFVGLLAAADEQHHEASVSNRGPKVLCTDPPTHDSFVATE